MGQGTRYQGAVKRIGPVKHMGEKNSRREWRKGMMFIAPAKESVGATNLPR